MARDGSNHYYEEIGNRRITYVPSASRPAQSDWAGSDVLRIQAYKGSANRALYQGAEFPIAEGTDILRLIQTICQVWEAGTDPEAR